MAMEVVGHDHPLMLIKPEETDDSWDLSCYACEQPISSSSSDYYGCKRCLVFLHETCSELPLQMTHHCHPQHPLTLLPNSPSFYGGKAICDVCAECCSKFIYRCSLCDYDIHVKCALEVLSIQQRIEHKPHPHQLTPLQKESMFLCDGCGIKHEGTSFLCTTCGFWINQKCALSPLSLKLNNDHHHHTLYLIYSIPEEDYCALETDCRICSKIIYRRNWVYYCHECPYLVHLHCAASANKHSTSEELDSSKSVTATSNTDLSKIHMGKIKAKELDPTPIYLPVHDDSVDIVTQFIKNTRIQGKYKGAAEIKHRSHDHLLTYFEKPIDHEHTSCSMNSLSLLLNGVRNDEKCNVCAQTITAQFYRCVQCNFSLHLWCAELPDELRHPYHPGHTLFFTTSNDFELCDCCNLLQTILYYTCEECTFIIHCKCATLPRVVKHETHNHTLALRLTLVNECISCCAYCSSAYNCGGCNLNLCVRCAILPRTVRHRYDKHPFTLTYSPLPYQTQDDFCQICEEGIDSKCWFYHCGECDQYLHTKCIFPVYRSKNVVYGLAIVTPRHHHRLTCVQPNRDLSCSLCKTNKHFYPVAYLCPPCNFCLCYDCRRCKVSSGRY